MKKVLPFLGIIAIIAIGVLVYQISIKEEKKVPPEITMPEKTLDYNPPKDGSFRYAGSSRVPTPSSHSPEGKRAPSKKIAIIVAFRDFRDEEYFVPKEILERAGAEIKNASNKMGKATGVEGGEVKIDFLVWKLDPADFDAVVFVGGSGCLANLDNEDSYEVARKTVSQNRVLAAICISSTILAKAGVLTGKKATVWSSPMDKSPIKILEQNGAIFEDKPVVIDGKIITGSGPAAAEEFGKAIIQVLTSI